VDVGLFLTAHEEVAWGAEFIRSSVAAGRRPGDHAVLFRTREGIAAWHHALTAHGIPVEVVGLGGLLELPEIVDLVSTLQVLDDPTANPAMVRLLAGPRWRLGPADLMALGRRAGALVRGRHGLGLDVPAPPEAAGSHDPDAHLMAALADAVAETDETDIVSLLDAVLDPADATLTLEARERVAACAADIERLRPLLALPLPDLVAAVITRTGLDVEVAVRDGAERRSESLGAFAQLAADFSDLDGDVTLRAFLTFLSVASNNDREVGGGAPSGADSVTLMTVHASKGLEFPIVVLPNVTNKVFPSNGSRSSGATNAGTLPYELRGDADDFPPPVSDWSGEKGLKAFKAAMKDHGEVEERRLAYVAITRAEERVVATSHWWGPTQKGKRGPSPYLLTLKDVVEAGAGSLVHWEPEPDDAENPFLAGSDPVLWPAPIDAPSQQRRVEAADAVRSRLQAGGSSVEVIDAPLSGDDAARAAVWARDAGVLAAELVAAHRPVAEVVLPTSLTASAVVEIGRDPDAFARRLRRPMPRPPAPAARRGTRFHAWVEQRFGQRPLLDRDDLLGAADDDRVLDDEQLQALQRAFEAGPFADRAPLHIEAPFQIMLAGRAIRGRIDAVYATDDGFDVIDWKTGTRPADPVQLAIYRLAWAATAGVSDDAVTAGFYVVPEGRVDRPELPTRDELIALLSPAAATDPDTP
jgi:DNA helicase-2/ATP-dependent DNA helicase PcrA